MMHGTMNIKCKLLSFTSFEGLIIGGFATDLAVALSQSGVVR
jgi:hypothetical protein